VIKEIAMRRLAFTLALVIASAAFMACEVTDATPTPSWKMPASTATTVLPQEDALELISLNWGGTRYGSSTVTGIIRNNTDRQISYASVTIALFNSRGAQVGSTIDNVADLAPHTDWRFEAFVLEESATTARVTSINGY
jgi:hypothetical protein